MLQRKILHRNLECKIYEPCEAGCGQQEMARINIDILDVSELKWMGMGEFNSDDYHIYYCGQESRRRNGVALIVNQRVGKAVLGYNFNTNPRQTFQHHSNPCLCTNHPVSYTHLTLPTKA